MMQCPIDIDNCAVGFLTHSRSDFVPLQLDDIDVEWPSCPCHHVGSLPNLVVTAANVLEVYTVRLQEDQPPKAAADSCGGALLDGIAGASLELVCHYRFIGGLTRSVSTNPCLFLLYQFNIFPFTFAFVNYTVIYKTKVERKDIDLIDEEEAQIGADHSSATSNKAEIYNEEARKKTQKHKPKRVESVNDDA
ncbi:hypothetical protein JHK87_012061 [Glycine soja]|nr:hypothetical protein JHK87_012061 [Glycine soja]